MSEAILALARPVTFWVLKTSFWFNLKYLIIKWYLYRSASGCWHSITATSLSRLATDCSTAVSGTATCVCKTVTIGLLQDYQAAGQLFQQAAGKMGPQINYILFHMSNPDLKIGLSIQTCSGNVAWTVHSVRRQEHQINRESLIFGYSDNVPHLTKWT